MKSRSYLFLGAVILFGILAGFLYSKTQYKLGLDVVGGIRLTYKVQTPALTADTQGQPKRDNTEVMQKVKTILLNRVTSVTGVTDATVLIKGKDEVIVELPNVSDPAAAREQIGSSASLKAYWAKNVQTANDRLRQYVDQSDEKAATPTVDFEDTFTHKILTPPTAQELQEEQKTGVRNPYEKMIDGWELLVTGDQLTNASANPVGTNSYEPNMTFTSEAGQKLRSWSMRYQGKEEKLAFVLDGRVLQIAGVQKNATLGDAVRIEGSFKPEYVKNLVNILNAGALPVDLQLEASEKVDPTIGQSALGKMVFAGLIAFAVISLFLIIYYAFPGFVAFLALMLYVLFTLTVLKLIGATFSLAGIAGFVLSVGMAVDANILVFERFKEEIKKGRQLHDALKLGFSRALPAIVDSNACSILTSLVLATLGTGPVKSFATTLIIGVAISLFTAVTVTRALLFFLTDSGIGNNVKLYGLNRNWFGEHLESTADSKPLQIVNNTRKWFTITAIVIVAGLVFMGLGGLKLNVEFTGGFDAQYARTTGMPSPQQIEKNLSANGFKGAQVRSIKDDNGRSLVDLTIPGGQLSNQSEDQRNAALAQVAGLPADSVPISFSQVGPAIQKETTNNAIIGMLASFGLIVIYLGFRFGLALGSFANGIRFGASAIAAGIKDVVVILGVAAAVGFFTKWPLSSLFITAMLTVIGFSVHDKIVIFDRVRENLRNPLSGEDFENLVNRSVTQSFARSINTAAAVVVTLIILIIFGTTTNDLRFFLIQMTAGIAWGTYSSIYTAAPVLYLWEKWIEKNKGAQHTLLGSAKTDQAKRRILRPVAGVPAPAAAAATDTPEAGRTYGQVRRRASAVSRSQQDLDDD